VHNTLAAGASSPAPLQVSLLTGGDDKSYALGLTRALADAGVTVDFIGSDALDTPELHESPRVRFLNLRGDQRPEVPLSRKITRLARYYARLIAYAARRKPRGLLHILWNNKVEWFDRTLLMYWYRWLGHRVLLTAHNVNAARRDGRDTPLNRLTLRTQYRLCSHIFVHTAKMKQELVEQFDVTPGKVSVIPFGLNDTAPRVGLSRGAARANLNLGVDCKVVLFFGQIAPYKGLEHLVRSLPYLAERLAGCTLVVAGKVKAGSEDYWGQIERELGRLPAEISVMKRIGHVPDEDIETYFEAADVLALPYVNIFQSGVPFLAYSFGLPVVATDVGSLAEDVITDQTGYVCRAGDPADLACALERFFASDLYREADTYRDRIARFARIRYSWNEVARITVEAYERLARSA
jgi:glycosyltransferase involved in cell wall biosynthesis